MMKRLFTILLACVMIFSVLPLYAAADQVVYESEPNDYTSDAQGIAHGDNVSGSLDGMFGTDIIDCYAFYLPDRAMVRITAMSANSNYGFRLDDASGFLTSSDSEGTYGGLYVEEIETTLDAGTYYISVVGTSYTDFTYALGLYAPGATAKEEQKTEPEDELGSSIDSPRPVEAYDSFTHTLSSTQLLMSGYYVSFSAPADGYLTMYYELPTANPNYAQLRFTLYDLYGNEIWVHEDNDNIRFAKLDIPLTKGDYILCTQTTFSHSSGETHTAEYVFSYTYVEDSVVEQMPCDDELNATAIAVGDTAFGITGESTYSDDYWALNLEEDSKVQIIVDSDVVDLIEVVDSNGDSSTHTLYGGYYSSGLYTDYGFPYVVADLTAGTNYILINGEMGHYEFTTELHTCEYETEVLEEPTCRSEGVALQECGVCQYSEEVPIPLVDHTWEDWTEIEAPTETEAGIEGRQCYECGEIEEREIPKKDSKPSTKPSDPIPTVKFKDVPEDAWYADAVSWAVGQGVTNGVAENQFGPDQNCTRAQVVTFLWRAAGSPKPTSSKNPFADVKADAYYYEAVLWAVENDITTGTSATTFSPDASCTRAQVATFLWRSQGEPEPAGTGENFSDVVPGAWYENAVMWAVENNITNGMGGGKFAPDGTCTRGQIVTFLYRAIA